MQIPLNRAGAAGAVCVMLGGAAPVAAQSVTATEPAPPTVVEHVVVKGTMPWAPLASATVSAAELARHGWTTAEAIRAARLRAGATSRSDVIYVDGVRSDVLPPANNVRSIVINGDAYSVLYSENDANVIEIESASPDRRFGWAAHVSPSTFGARNPLAPRLAARHRGGDASINLPIPGAPFAVSVFAGLQDRTERRPLVTASGGDTAMSASASSFTAHLSGEWKGGRTTAALTMGRGRDRGAGTGGTVRAEAGTESTASNLNGRWLFERGVKRRWRSAVSRSVAETAAEAVTHGDGFRILDDDAWGGADLASAYTRRHSWQFAQTVEAPERRWLAGLHWTYDSLRESLQPNGAGQWLFGNRQSFVDAVSGAPAWQLRWTRPVSNAASTTVLGAFAQREWMVGAALLRVGARSDYQQRDGLRWSPRISVFRRAGAWTLQAGAGVFRQDWTADLLAEGRRAAGSSVREIVTADLQDPARALSVRGVRSSISPAFTRPRRFVASATVQRAIGSVDSGIEYRRVASRHRPGLRRAAEDDGYVDVLEAGRSLDRHELRVRVQSVIRSTDIVAHYEWQQSRDNGDGPLAFSTRPDDVRDEWAASGGVAPHRVSVIVTPPQIHEISTGVIFMASSAAPFDLRTGVDRDGRLLFVDRPSAQRNAGHGPAFRSLDAYAQRRVSVPLVASRRLTLVLMMALDNLLGDRHVTDIGRTVDAPVYNLPLSAGPGRTLRLSVRVAR